MKKQTPIAKSTAQQGDVLLRKLETLPAGSAKTLGKLRCTLAEGEHTGHSHVVEDDEAELIQIGERILLRLGREATVKHQEHKPITLSPGIWEVGRVKEYDWFSQMDRKVMD